MKFGIHLILKLLFTAAAILFFTNQSISGNKPGENRRESGSVQKQSDDQDDFYSKDYLRYSNYIYKENISTVLLHLTNWPLSRPIIEFNKGEQLKLSFDDLDGYLKDYFYTIIHCNVDWQPSSLVHTEYIQGVPEDYIFDHKYSRNTRQKYIHYNLIFPNENMQLTRSGNYLIKVYEDGNPDEVVITWRFMVTEKLVSIAPNIHSATNVNDRLSKQEIDFNILHNKYQLTNPYQDLKVVVVQNNRMDAAITDLQPVFVRNNELVYDYEDGNLFPGGNEFRFVNIKSIRYRSEGIKRIGLDSLRNNHVWLHTDKKRPTVYLDQPDINGQYLIRNDDLGSDDEVDADYTWVHFELAYPENVPNGDFYVFGALSRWGYPREFKMNWNEEKHTYETSVYLKQGYYNYIYVFLPDENSTGDITKVERSYSDTENEYTILIYHRSIGDIYDRLVGSGVFNSRKP